jgi:hypothetical protein
MSGPWQVKAFENFGAPGEEDVYDLGIHKDLNRALAVAERCVWKSLEAQVHEATSVADLIDRFESFGEEAQIWDVETMESPGFSGRDYAHSQAREVFCDWMRTELHPSLRKAYRETRYTTFLPAGDAVICIGQTSAAADDWLAEVGQRSAIFFSAQNPMSRQLTQDDNEHRHDQLLEAVKQSGRPAVEGRGRGASGDWSEDSVLIAGLDVQQANRLARQFEQAGYVWIQRGKPASLRVRTTRDTWVEEADLA